MAKKVSDQNAPIWLTFWSCVLLFGYEHLPKSIFVRIFYMSFQRPFRTRALENVAHEAELGQSDGGVVLVGPNGGFWWVMLATFSENRNFLRPASPAFRKS